MTERRQVMLVGAGPIGIEMAVALKRGGISYAHLDASQIGSTISWYAPHTHFFSSPERIAIAGVPLQTLDQSKATREEYLLYLRTVVQQFDLRVETFERVDRAERRSDGTFDVRSVSIRGERHWIVDQIILAIGDMHRPRMLEIPGENLEHVSHYFEEPHRYFRRRVLIVGGKNSAIEAAIRCVRAGAAVTLSYRRTELDPAHIKFWLMPEISGMIRDGRIEFLPSTSIETITTDGAVVRRADGELTAVAADAVLLLTGYEQDSTLFESLGVKLEGDGRRPILDGSMQTSVAGIYVAGTAVAGTQLGGVKEFIETAHVHVERIMNALAGSATPTPDAHYDMPES